MALIEALMTGTGAAVAKATLKLWLKDNDIAVAVGGSLADILKKKITDARGRNKTQRSFEAIRDLSADSLEKMLQKEAEGVDEERLKIIANAAGETLRHWRQNNVPPVLFCLAANVSDRSRRLVHYFDVAALAIRRSMWDSWSATISTKTCWFNTFWNARELRVGIRR